VTYGFQGRLKAEFPSTVIIDITEVCNLECVHCPHPAFKKSEHYGARFLQASLNQKAVDEVKEHGAQYIRYCAEGEPLIHPQCYDFLDYAVRHSGTYVTLTTNGTILNERRIRKLLHSGLHMIDVSLDAHTPETYSIIRKGGDLNVTRENVLKLLDWSRDTNTKVVVSYIEQPQNKHETEYFRKYWRESSAHQVVVRRLHSAAGAIRWAGAASTDRYPCVYPWERIVLNPAGQLKFCPQDWFGGAVIADYRTTTIKETWGGEFYTKLREAHLQNKCFGVCKDCPDWKQTRWPGQGLSYADLMATV
jgi:pyruvate-formate lyase-activating enzyme